MSVKRIRLYVKEKRKIHDNLRHKEHSTHFPHHHSVFAKLPQILNPLPQKYHNSAFSHTHTDTCEKKRKSIIF